MINIHMLKLSGDIQANVSNNDMQTLTAGVQGGRIDITEELEFSDRQYLVLEVESFGTTQFSLELEFYDSTDANAVPVIRCKKGFLPQTKVLTYFDFAYLDAQTIFLPRTPGKLKSVLMGTAMKKEDIKRIAIRLYPHYEPQTFILHRLETASVAPDCELREAKLLVDELGQLAIDDWEGKTASANELTAYLRTELKNSLDEGNNKGAESNIEDGTEKVTEKEIFCEGFGEGYSQFGGFTARQFEPTGYFRVVHDELRWWMVDPEGYAFFSAGLDVVSPGEAGRIDGIEPCFTWLPEQTGPYAEAYITGEVRKEHTYFNYAVANLIRAFGDSWRDSWARITRSRLLDWKFNTVANWSDKRFMRWAKLPYVIPLRDFPTTEKRIYRDFPDVFSEEYSSRSLVYAEQLGEYLDDPYLIGYFMANEPHWGFGGKVNLAAEMFRTREPFASKRMLVRFLRDSYTGDIVSLNEAWGRSFSSFDDVLTLAFDDIDGVIYEDLYAFSKRMVNEFVKIPAEALKVKDPHHLNLGMRYAWISSELLYEGSEYFDVFSINCYRFKPDEAELTAIHDLSGKPLMIGEYHFGAPDVGKLAFGLKAVASQEERGNAYRYYVENSANIKALIGVHYFILNDQATLGRFDGEAFQIGVVDVCHKPYEPFVQGIRTAHRNLYEIMTGSKQPYDQAPKELFGSGF